MAKKQNVIEQLISERSELFKKEYGANFHSTFEFKGVIKETIDDATDNVKKAKKMYKLLAMFATSQIPDEQLKVEASRQQLRDYALWGIKSLIDLIGALDNFNFRETLKDVNDEEG